MVAGRVPAVIGAQCAAKIPDCRLKPVMTEKMI